MLVLAVGAKLITRELTTDHKRSRWQNLLEIVVTLIAKQIEEVGLPHPKSILGFWAPFSCSSARPAFAPSFLATNHLPVAFDHGGARVVCDGAAVPLFGIAEQGVGNYLKAYLQPTFIMLPFNVISEISRTLALAVRLFGNMMSGAMIIAILLTITPFIFPVIDGARSAHRHGAAKHILAAVYIAAATRTREPKSEPAPTI